jgi:hypothetical protein
MVHAMKNDNEQKPPVAGGLGLIGRSGVFPDQSSGDRLPPLEQVAHPAIDCLVALPVPDALKEKFAISGELPPLYQWALLGFMQAHKPKERTGRPKNSAGTPKDHEIVRAAESVAREEGLDFHEVLKIAVPALEKSGDLKTVVHSKSDSSVHPDTHPKRLKRVKKQRDEARIKARPALIAALSSTLRILRKHSNISAG